MTALVAAGASLKLGARPIGRAAAGGSVEALRFLVDAGCCVDGTDKQARRSRSTPLYEAVSRGHAEAVAFLLANGALVDKYIHLQDVMQLPPDKWSQATAILRALLDACSSPDARRALLNEEASHYFGYLPVLPAFIESRRFDDAGTCNFAAELLSIGASPARGSPLQSAVRCGYVGTATLLIKNGAPLTGSTDRYSVSTYLCHTELSRSVLFCDNARHCVKLQRFFDFS
jgi:ankyrin repeat protein